MAALALCVLATQAEGQAAKRDTAKAKPTRQAIPAKVPEHEHDAMPMGAPRDSAASRDEHAGHDMGAHDMSSMGGMTMPPMAKGLEMPMIPGMESARPSVTEWLPGADVDPSTLPVAVPRKLASLKDGDTLDLSAQMVRRTIRGKSRVMYGFNGQYPGPLIRVPQNATIIVRFVNRLDQPSAVHWHGVRLENASDGAPGVTQEAVPPGGSFVYRVHFRDAGIYWYHPHVREDVQQALGLYGNMMVDSPDPAYYSSVNDEQFLMLEDLLENERGVFPFGKEAADFAIMGRFGNVFLVNGEPDYRLTARRGDVVRLFLTNVSNARMYNLDFGGNPIKLVAADVGKYEREERVETVLIAPAQRYIVEVKLDKPGSYAITNRVQALSNFRGEFVPMVDTLGTIAVLDQPTTHDFGAQFATLRTNASVVADIDAYRKYFDKPPDKQLFLTVNMQGLPVPVTAFMSVDTMYFPPAEWADGMPDMNWLATTKEVHWIMRDPTTKAENMDIDWRFKAGDVVKIRITNDGQSMHPMSHPIHFHGQRFLVLAVNGVPQTNLVWRDVAIVPVGTAVDVLLDASNPGKWMAHCHIAEHLEAGMHMVFTVEPKESQ
jgi:FtsP/CotA-like multicopper oxidase with cupredoxin domain